MNSKYSPGPWECWQDPSEVGTNYWRIRTSSEDIQDTLRGYCGEANARLATASPVLADALRDLLAAIDIVDFSKPGAFKIVAACEKAREALAKVEVNT